MERIERQLNDIINSSYDSDDDDNNIQSFQNDEEQQDKEKYIIDTAVILRKSLIEYAEQGAWPLCEFLDFTNVENYIKWLLTYG